MIVDLVRVKLSAQRGLMMNSFPNLRAVCVNSTENLLSIYFYIDGEISEEDKESCECVLDDFFSDFSYLMDKGMEFETPFIRLDFPNRMPLIGHWVYYRKENTAEYL